MKLFLKKILPRSTINILKNIHFKVQIAIISSINKSKILCNTYYIFNNQFSNEHQAVIKGRQAYYISLKKIGKTCALLRRNIHRIEKGLIMQPRRNIFAESFIKETIECYKDAVTSVDLDPGEKKWATDVLDEYFKIVSDTSIIKTARTEYSKTRANVSLDTNQQSVIPSVNTFFKPYKYTNLQKSEFSYGELEKLFIQRRSVRWYRNEHVALDLIQKAANIASLAPSACNRQPYRFLFCNEKEKATAIAKCAGGTTGFAENLPSIIVIVGDLSAYPFERDRHLIYIDGSLGAMQLMLALETLGLSSCSINWPDVEHSERKIRKLINLNDYERIVMLLAVGYADFDGGIPFSQKKINEKILEDIS